MNKILIVEDQKDVLEVLEFNLKQEGYRVATADCGEIALKLAAQQPFSLILLDVMLPGMNGLDVCRELRAKGVDTPSIMLTAKGEEVDRVVGLELGADDYVTKPFSLRELLARVRARLRRDRAHPGVPAVYSFGNIQVNFEKLSATRKGIPLDLTAKELHLFQLLVRCRGEIVSRSRILSEVWGYDPNTQTRTVDNYIVRLRQKLEKDPTNPRHILTVYGEGYTFVA
jgi:two-component system alkaline phosphatase synthesis response regulator PhoP